MKKRRFGIGELRQIKQFARVSAEVHGCTCKKPKIRVRYGDVHYEVHMTHEHECPLIEKARTP